MGYTMTKTKAPREFWILTPPNNKDRVIYDSNPQWIGERNLVAHVREVLPDDEFATYISDLLKTRSETFDELERVKKALASAVKDLERLQAGFAGMFGNDVLTFEKDALESAPIMINEALEKIEAIEQGES